MLKALFVSFATALALSSCGIKATDTSSQYSYDMQFNGCRTGAHSFSSQDEYCRGLSDTYLNNGCACEMRKSTYQNAGCGPWLAIDC